MLPESEFTKRLSGFTVTEETHWNVFRWFIKGIFYCLGFLLILRFILFILRFLRSIFILIRSNKRLLCGIGGALGGLITYLYIIPPSATSGEMVLMVLFGMLLGAAIGVASWQLISLRVLKLSPVRND
jgi:hypothetical protein